MDTIDKDYKLDEEFLPSSKDGAISTPEEASAHRPTQEELPGAKFIKAIDENYSDLRILIIEDDPDMLTLLDKGLGSVGFKCDAANSAKTALNRLAYSEPDLVLLDLHLNNEINGEDLLLHIRHNPRLENTSVVVMTAYPEMVGISDGMAELTLIKPFKIDAIVNLVKRFCRYRSDRAIKYIVDPITGLYHRDFFINQLEHAIKRSTRHRKYLFSTMVIRPVKDQPQSENFERAILQQIAWRLKRRIRQTDTPARLSGNTFVTLFENIKEPEDTQIINERIRRNLLLPYTIKGRSHKINFQIGSVIHDRRYHNPTDVLSAAEETIHLAC